MCEVRLSRSKRRLRMLIPLVNRHFARRLKIGGEIAFGVFFKVFEWHGFKVVAECINRRLASGVIESFRLCIGLDIVFHVAAQLFAGSPARNRHSDHEFVAIAETFETANAYIPAIHSVGCSHVESSHGLLPWKP